MCVCLIIDLTLIIRAVIESASNSKSIPFGLWVCFLYLSYKLRSRVLFYFYILTNIDFDNTEIG